MGKSEGKNAEAFRGKKFELTCMYIVLFSQVNASIVLFPNKILNWIELELCNTLLFTLFFTRTLFYSKF